MRYVRIPAERVGAVIGPEGATRKFLEERLGIRVHVDSTENEVQIDDSNPRDPVGPLKAEDIVRAIARGFSPEHAFKLLAEDFYLEIIDLHDYVGKDREGIRRVSARVIGSEGKTRRIIEELSGALMSVYGHTVSLIGDTDSLAIAKSAVDMILEGSEHAQVYRFLEGKRRAFKRSRLEF